MKNLTTPLYIAVVSICFCNAVNAEPLTFFEMSSTGSFVIPSGDYYYDVDDLTSVSNSFSGNPSYYQNSPVFRWGGWRILFGGAPDVPLQPGSYDATRFPFGLPGFDITGFGRGHNTLSATFEVLDIAYEDNTPTRFAANFTLNSTMTGRLSYNSEAFSVVPEPSTQVLLIGVLLAATCFGRRIRCDSIQAEGMGV